MTQDRLSACGRLHLLAIAISCVNPTEAALEWASDAGLVRGGSPSEEGRTEVLLKGNRMEWRCGKSVRRLHEPFRIVPVQAKHVAIGESLDCIKLAFAAQSVQQFEEGVLTLAANCVVDVLRVECGVGVDGREVASPYDGNARAQLANIAAILHAGGHLRTGHDGYPEQFED